MVGLLDLLGGLLGGGNQPPSGLLAQGQQPQTQQYGGMLDDPALNQLIQQRRQQGFTQGLLQAGQPSRYKVGLLQALGQGVSGANQADSGINDSLINARIKTMVPSWKETKDAFGNPLVYNELNPKQTMPLTGGNNPFGVTGGNGGGNSTQPTSGQPQLNGDEFLQSLPKPTADQVKALAEGRMQFPGGFALKSPYWQQMISAVSQYDPNFDAVNYNARSSTRKSFTSGPDANNITALNTAMSHAASLKDAYDNLDNTDYPSYNKAKNYLGNELGNETVQTNTAAVATRGHALSEELAKVFRSTGMAESDIKSWENKLSANASPAQSKEVLNSAMDLIDGRLSALGAKYNQGMGTSKQGIDLLSPDAQEAYAKVRGSAPKSTNIGAIQNPNVQQGMNKPSDSAVQFLKQNPQFAPQFEAKYGISAKNYLGL